jgi:hypothetical protein
MKLATIQHFRCAEPTFYWTTVWIPDDMTKEQFDAAVVAARDAYLDKLNAFKDQVPPNDYRPYHQPQYELQPGRTVSEIRQEWEKKKAAWEAWDKTRQKTKPRFLDILCADGRLKPLQATAEDISIELDWGHRHGWPIDYDEDKDF